jgi:hypothetical protein
VNESDRPAFLLGGLEAARLAAFARSRGWTETRTTFPALGLTLVSGLPSEALTIIRRCGCIPAAVGPASVEWLGIEGPPQIPQGQQGLFKVAFRFRGLASMSSRIRLASWWRAVDGTDLGRDAQRLPLPEAISSGERVDVVVPLTASVAPGRYRVTIDLVDEDVTWFEWMGIPPASLAVEITP